MIDCLKGLIGLSVNVSGIVPSGLYCDALPDISETYITKLVDGEEGIKQLYEEIENRAILKLRTHFVREINEAHKIHDMDKCTCLICENKELLSTALWYLIGSEIMYTRATSSRVNAYTTIDRKKAGEMREELYAAFLKELTMVVNSIDVHASACFTCNDNLQPNDFITFREPII